MKNSVTIRINHQDIIFENDDYLAVNKHRGWPVHQTLDPNRPNLYSSCLAFIKNRSNGQESYLALHHRLDVQTSGIVLFAKTTRANPVLAEVFEARKAKKIYRAICHNTPIEQQGEWVDFLQKKSVNKIERMVKVEKGGQKAITHYRVIESYLQGKFCLLELELVTGRMHQIRAQASIAGVPLVGDDLYGDLNFNHEHKLSAQMLHAHRLDFFDPLSNQEINIVAPIPDDFSQCLKWVINGTQKKIAPKIASYRYILFNKPYNVLCQFTSPNPEEVTLANFDLPTGVYPVGRLDKDSEGLLLLTDDGATKDRLSNPRFEKEKTYWVEVENIPSEESLNELKKGITVGKERFRPCKVKLLAKSLADNIAPRVPPIRFRQNIPTCWLEITITEGKNRQVRRMTAAIGHPTLRLIRNSMDGQILGALAPGKFQEVKKF